ncbi:hypothetical protein F183_A49870 [Bryobacterales bacterium F-183]|nr:hypothetical protein F183_A49870 [Bryobacterales bacterium F-183]
MPWSPSAGEEARLLRGAIGPFAREKAPESPKSGYFATRQYEGGSARVVRKGPCQYASEPESRHPCAVRHARGSPTCRWSFIDQTGKPLFAGDFDEAYGFHEGLAAVRQDRGGKWGFVDARGQLVIPAVFDEVTSFSEGWALVRSATWSGYIDRSGAQRLKANFYASESYHEGLAVQALGKSGYVFVGRDGKQAVPGVFAKASEFRKGVAHVLLQDLRTVAYINRAGKQLTNIMLPAERGAWNRYALGVLRADRGK